jgi:hypothetical protein
MYNPKLEKDVKREINKYLKSLNEGFFFPYNPFGGTPGIPDKIGVFRKKFIGIEVKRPNKKHQKNGGLTPLQILVHKNICKNGGHIIVAYSKEDVKSYFEKYLIKGENNV